MVSPPKQQVVPGRRLLRAGRISLVLETIADSEEKTQYSAHETSSLSQYASKPEAVLSQETFDAAFYLSEYPDVAAAGVDPYQHYLQYGRFEGRVPNAASDCINAQPSPTSPDDQTSNGPEELASVKKKNLAVVTMVYNEPDYLPMWIKYYSGQVGIENCYIIDHASDPENLISLTSDISVVRLPRTPLDEQSRAGLVSAYCAMLLGIYDNVLFCDVDEIVVPDPAKFSSLREYAERNTLSVVTTFGVDLVQSAGEQTLDPSRPLLQQRHYARPNSAVCKPLLIRRPVQWAPGFHYCQYNSVFSDLYLFHLAFVDYTIIYRRQAKRAATPRTYPLVSHHSISPDVMVQHTREAYADIPSIEDVKWETGDPEFDTAIARLLNDGQARNAYESQYQSSCRWQVHKRFWNSF